MKKDKSIDKNNIKDINSFENISSGQCSAELKPKNQSKSNEDPLEAYKLNLKQKKLDNEEEINHKIIYQNKKRLSLENSPITKDKFINVSD